MKNFKKILCLILAMMLAMSFMTGCGEEKGDGKTHISIGNWPVENDANYPVYNERLAEFNKNHPEIVAEGVPFVYDTKTFVAKAAAGQLPTSYVTWFTEKDMIVSMGYCKDISKNLEGTGILEAYNPKLLELAKGENGEIWGLPYNAYAMGLHINKKLFRDAGLVNEDGTIKYPQTYDELAEFAATIKEKTGVAGFVMPTIDNGGGWHFINIAWSYGTEFMKKDSNGKWKATFDSAEFKAACQWLYDMKWKHNALYEQSTISIGENEQFFGTHQAGMMFAPPPAGTLVTKYGMKIEDIACASLPAGPKGRYAQTGGSYVMFSNNATDAEVDAALKWHMEYQGFSPVITDEVLSKAEVDDKTHVDAGKMFLPYSLLQQFTNRENEDKLNAIHDKYINVDMKDYENYMSAEGVEFRSEEPVCCQQLYSVMDGVIQKILTNKDVDIDAVVKEAVGDFQKNHLDNL